MQLAKINCNCGTFYAALVQYSLIVVCVQYKTGKKNCCVTVASNICCPRDAVSRTANVERTGRHKWVNIVGTSKVLSFQKRTIIVFDGKTLNNLTHIIIYIY